MMGTGHVRVQVQPVGEVALLTCSNCGPLGVSPVEEVGHFALNHIEAHGE